MDRLDAMQTFVRVIEKGSFSAVAKERGIGQPAVSKHISALEEELGTELIYRASRSIALTEAGRDFYGSALRILEDFENAASRIGRECFVSPVKWRHKHAASFRSFMPCRPEKRICRFNSTCGK